MKKIISLILIIIVLFSSLNFSFADVFNYAKASNSEYEIPKTILLPKIPIYISNYNSYLVSDKFESVNKMDDSFYTLKIENTETITKKEKPEKQLIWITYGTIMGALIGAIIMLWDPVYDEDDIDLIHPRYDTSPILPATIVGLALGYVLPYTKERQSVPVKKQYELSLFRQNKEISVTKLILHVRENISNSYLLNFFKNADEDLRKWDNLYKLYNTYKTPLNFFAIENKYKIKLKMLGKNKGEFETTNQYNDRTKKEQIRKNELQASMEQEISIIEEKWEIEKFALLHKIKKEISEIEFIKFYDFEISNYNADRQSFTFNISGTEKTIVIPIAEAPRFKENTDVFIVQKTLRPTLNGKWEKTSDDFILVNTKKDEIIPWEGEIPNYAETAVEFPPILSASVKIIEPSGEGYLDAEETAIIKVTLSNSGKGSAKRTRISLFQQKGSTIYYDVSNKIDEILPNQSITSDFKLTIPENIESGIVEFKISFLEEQGFEPSPLSFTAQTRARLKPDLQIADFGVEDANRDGKISKGETADITIRIQNKGYGKAKNTSLDIIEDHLTNLFIISEKHFELGNLHSGESMDITFSISTNKRVQDIVNISMNINEERSQFSIEDKITLEFEKTKKQLEPIIFVGSDIKTEIMDVAGLFIDIEQNIPESNKPNENALAIIFGIENYKNVSGVTFANRDANFVKEYFEKTLGIKRNNIYFIINENVTKAEFDKVFSKEGWLDKRVKREETEIYFYYAGHGAPEIKNNKAYLIPYDGDSNYASITGYELDKLYENLGNLNAKSVTIFLDACFSGANRENEMLLANARPISIEVNSPIVKGITVFSATSNKEISSAWQEKKHGLFTYFMLKGMQGNADVNKDKKLTIGELGKYIKQNVSETAGFIDREQTPQMITNNENRILINF